MIQYTDSMSTKRTESLRDEISNSQRELSVHRGKVFSEVYRENRRKHPFVTRALAFSKLFETLPVRIYENELLVGGITEKRRGAFLVPENNPDGMQIHGKIFKALENAVLFLLRILARFVSLFYMPAGERIRVLGHVLSITRFGTVTDRATIGLSLNPEEKRIIKKDIAPYWKKRSAYTRYRSTLTTMEKKEMNQFLYAAEHAFVGGVFLFYPPLEPVLKYGLLTVIEETEKKRAGLDRSQKDYKDKDALYEAMILSARAVIVYARHTADAAEKAIAITDSTERRAELNEIAEICRNVPARPARTFREGLQSLWFGYIALANDDGGHEVPFGRWDQLLYPLYKDDLEHKRITPEEALELIECFLLKTNEIEYLLHNGASFFEDGNSGRLTITIGGMDRQGNDATNELSYLFLQALSNTRMPQPNPAVRINRNSPGDFVRLATDIMCSGANTVQLFNDVQIIDGFSHQGFGIEDSRDYIISGCVQPIPHSTYGSVCAGHLALPRLLERFMDSGTDYDSYEGFFLGFKDYLIGRLRNMIGVLGKVDAAHAAFVPNTFLDALFDGVPESGREIKRGGAAHNLSGISLLGIGTLADSLMAIRISVYRDKRFTLKQLRKICRENFHGREAERLYLQNRIPKYGNDIPEVDSIVSEITGILHAELKNHRSYRNGQFTLGIHSENGHVVFGLLTGATPDGRRQQAPYSIGAGSARGGEQNGYTASLKSFSRIRNREVVSGVSVNLRINPTLVNSEDKRFLFEKMVETYFFDLGGQNLQTTVVSRETLLEAQKSPEQYQDLLVRISGYSARFVELTAQTQDEIISRTEYTEGA